SWQEHEKGSVCAAIILSRGCLLWVKSGHWSTTASCPLYPRKRTSEPARVLPSAHQLRQLGDVGRDPSRLINGLLTRIPDFRLCNLLCPNLETVSDYKGDKVTRGEILCLPEQLRQPLKNRCLSSPALRQTSTV